MPFLMEFVNELERLKETAGRIEVERATLDAKRQQLTRDLDAVKARARVLAAQVRAGIKTKYGYGSEKLIEFGLRPRRRSLTSLQEEQAGAALVTPPPDPDDTSEPRG